MTVPPAHRRRRRAPHALTTLSRGGVCGAGKDGQRIPRNLPRNRQGPPVHQTNTEIPLLLPEARDPLRRLALRGASFLLTDAMATRLRNPPGSASVSSLASASPRGAH